jgi:hypothetical protein
MYTLVSLGKTSAKDSIFAADLGITSMEYPDIKSLKCLLPILLI